MFGLGRRKPARPMPGADNYNSGFAGPIGDNLAYAPPPDGGVQVPGPSAGAGFLGAGQGPMGMPGLPGMGGINKFMGGMRPPVLPGMNGKVGLPGLPGIAAGRFKMQANPLKALGGLFGFGKKKRQPVQPAAPYQAPSPTGIGPSFME